MLAGTEEKCAQSFPLFLFSQSVGFESVDGTFYSLAFKLSQLVTEVNKSSVHTVKKKRDEILGTHTDAESSLNTDLLRTDCSHNINH